MAGDLNLDPLCYVNTMQKPLQKKLLRFAMYGLLCKLHLHTLQRLFVKARMLPLVRNGASKRKDLPILHH